MINAKEELLEDLRGELPVCAEIIYEPSYSDKDTKTYRLTLEYTTPEWELFLEQLNFYYDNGYGGQELYGTVWLNNGNWLERGEYDGSEWWEYKTYPEIPEYLK